MSYLDEGYSGSIDGVPFFTRGHTTAMGRKTAIYRLPFESRGVAHRDMGRAPREFSIDAFLLEDVRIPGMSLRMQRDALIKVLEAPGRKLLVHPIYGRVYVVTEGVTGLVESTEQGGLIEIKFNAIEARDEIAQPLRRPDAQAVTIERAKKLRLVGGEAYVRNSNTSVPDFVNATNLDVLDDIIDGLTDMNAIIGHALAVPAHFAAQIERIANEAAMLLNLPQLLYNTIDATTASVIQSINTVAGRNRRGIGNLQQVVVLSSALGSGVEEPPPIDTPSRAAERNNRAQMLIAMRASALSSATTAAASATYASADEARSMLKTIQDALAGLSDNAISGVEPDVDVFDAIRDLSAAIAQQLGEIAANLADVTTYTTADTVPMVTIAYHLYGDASRFEELLERNPQVVHPMMVPGRTTLEVLTS
jgi:prophage DNA circulation protein